MPPTPEPGRTEAQLELPLYAAPEPEMPGPHIDLDGRRVAYALRRSRHRRTIALFIDERGVRVAAPMRAAQSAILTALRDHAAWIIRKLDEWHATRPQPCQWKAGGQLMFHGTVLTLAARDGVTALVRDGPLLCYGPVVLPAAELEAQVRDWLRQRALSCFTEWCHRFSAQLGVATPTVRLSSARTRWGSCHASGRISMNWRLVQAPLAWIAYVAAHEVAHLRQMNHTPAFWRTVAELLPDYAERRIALRRHVQRYLLL